MSSLIRLVKLGCVGQDVEACKRACHRYLKTGFLDELEAQPVWQRRTFGWPFRTIVKLAEKKAGLVEDGVVGPALEYALRKAKAFDAYADLLLDEYAAANAYPSLVYPHAKGSASWVGQGLHQTAGLAGNWAVDFMAPGGTVVVAVEDAEVIKVSGNSPSYVPDPVTGIFGWNIHYRTVTGYRWFSTHYGTYDVSAGQRVKAGTRVGTVGRWPGDPGRSHTHLGVTSPYSSADAKARVLRVSRASVVNAR